MLLNALFVRVNQTTDLNSVYNRKFKRLADLYEPVFFCYHIFLNNGRQKSVEQHSCAIIGFLKSFELTLNGGINNSSIVEIRKARNCLRYKNNFTRIVFLLFKIFGHQSNQLQALIRAHGV